MYEHKKRDSNSSESTGRITDILSRKRSDRIEPETDGKRSRRSRSPLYTRISVGMEEVPAKYDMEQKVLGHRRANLKFIAKQTGAEVSLRGAHRSRRDPLHIYIEHETAEGLQAANKLVLSLLESVRQEFTEFCPEPSAAFKVVQEEEPQVGAMEQTTPPQVSDTFQMLQQLYATQSSVQPMPVSNPTQPLPPAPVLLSTQSRGQPMPISNPTQPLPPAPELLSTQFRGQPMPISNPIHPLPLAPEVIKIDSDSSDSEDNSTDVSNLPSLSEIIQKLQQISNRILKHQELMEEQKTASQLHQLGLKI